MKLISIILQDINGKNGVLFSIIRDHFQIPGYLVGRIEKPWPIKVWLAIAVGKEYGSQRTICVIRRFPDLVCGLKMNLFYGVILKGLFLISINPGARFQRDC